MFRQQCSRVVTVVSAVGALACSSQAGPEHEQTAESELRSAICNASAIALQPGSQTIMSSQAHREAAAVPDCAAGPRAPVASYKFSVPEPGSVRMDPIDTPGPGWQLQAFRGVQCQSNRPGQWMGCGQSTFEGYTSRYFRYGNEQYVRPGDDLIVGVAGIGGAELVAHELVLTFEPSCGNGRAEDNLVAGQFQMRSPPKHFEECEDGGRAVGDGCSASCKIESACTLEVPPIGREALAVVDVPAACRTARLKGTLPAEATVVARINATSDDSVIATVLDVDGNVGYRAPRPNHRQDPWLTVTVGPKLPATSSWACGEDPRERCAERQCLSANFLCRVRYEPTGGKTYVRVSNAHALDRATFDVRIDRNLGSIYAYP